MSRPAKKIEYIILSLLTVFLITFSFYNFGFEIYTYFWHIKNPDPIVLNNFKVNIPDDLIAEISENNVLEVTYLRDPLMATIYLKQMDFEPSSKVCDLSIGRVEKTTCKISGKECIRVRFDRGETESGYIEALFLTKEKAYISFQGNRNERHYLLQIIESLEVS